MKEKLVEQVKARQGANTGNANYVEQLVMLQEENAQVTQENQELQEKLNLMHQKQETEQKQLGKSTCTIIMIQ